MKIEKLTDNKIRIIIDLDELSEKNIDINSLSKNNDKAHLLRTLTFFLQINSLKVLKSRLIFLSNIFSFSLVVSCCLWYNIKNL